MIWTDLYNIFISVTSIFSLMFIAILIAICLILSIFFEHTGKFTQFLHRISVFYLIYYLWLEGTGSVCNYTIISSDTTVEFIQENTIFFKLFIIYSTITVCIFLFGVAERFFMSQKNRLEFVILIFCIHLGGIFALRLHTFIDILISLEIVTLGSYTLVTFERQNRFSTYAGVQYFILGSLPSAILVLAFAFFYIQGGSIAIQDLDILFNITYIDFNYNNTEIAYIMNETISSWFFNICTHTSLHIAIINNSFMYIIPDFYYFFTFVEIESIINKINPINFLSLIGVLFLFFNILFKLTAAPFHVWAPSVYGNAPVSSVTFLSIYSKIIVFFLLFKFITTFLHAYSFFLIYFLLVIGIISICIGMLGAFSEKVIKRFFVYSSIGHVGFMLIGFAINTLKGYSAAFHYLSIYVLSSFIIWFFIITIGRNKNHLSHFVGIQNNEPRLVLIFAFLVFSISGIPPLGGFFIKLDILSALLNSSHFFINYLLFFFTVASFYYYLRLIKILFFDTQDNTNSTISFSHVYNIEYPYYIGRFWIMALLILILSFYCFIVEKPLLIIQFEILHSMF